MLSAMDVARYFLALASEEDGELISNMKLQKLVYYAQGFSLALRDEPLFAEPIKAWTHGPVVPSLYHEYKQFEGGPVILDGEINWNLYSPEARELLDEVYQVYGQYSASGLRALTHSELPWSETPSGEEIPRSAMKEFFKTQILDG